MLMDVTYETRSQILNSVNLSDVDFACNIRRAPVSFRGRVKEPIVMRQMMTALHEVIIGDFRFNQRAFTLDPVITVHPDELFFEAFSSDQSAYVRMAAKLEAFEIEGNTEYGTTNIDFTPQLRNAMSDLRSSRPTYFTVGAAGFSAETKVASMQKLRYEEKVDLPDSWVKGFLQVQSALAAKPFTFDVRPVDLITVINYFMDNRARGPRRGLRYDFKPTEGISIVLEPWMKEFPLKDSNYSGYERNIRTWGRQRLELLLSILPFAEKVTIGLLGRGLPHFYICHCGDFSFTLVLSGWVRNDWSATSALDLLAPQTEVSDEAIARVYNHLVQTLKAKKSEIETYSLLDAPVVEAALFALCQDGRAIYDPTSRRYRSRELFPKSLELDAILKPNPRITEAKSLIAEGLVSLESVAPSDTRRGEVKILAEVQTEDVLVAVDTDLRIRFAQCSCQFFRENIMNLGPCEHILAARFAADSELANAFQEAAK